MIKIRLLCIAAVPVICMAIVGCDKKETPAAAPAVTPPATPVVTTQAVAPAKPAAVASAVLAKKTPPAQVVKPVPADWISMRDDVRKFEFKVPAGTKHEQSTKGTFLIYGAEIPKPHDIGVMVVAYKDAKKTKDDLFGDVDDILVAGKAKDVKLSAKKEINDNYSEAEVTFIDDDGKTKNKGKVLVVTDVTDNYVMIVASPEATYATETPTIDEIIGSFTMDE